MDNGEPTKIQQMMGHVLILGVIGLVIFLVVNFLLNFGENSRFAVDRIMGTYWGWLDDILTYGCFTSRGRSSFVPWLVATGMGAVILRMILKKFK